MVRSANRTLLCLSINNRKSTRAGALKHKDLIREGKGKDQFMARSPLTDTFQKVQGMVSYVQQNLSGDEYNLFLDMIAPESEPEPAAKKTRKKRTRAPRTGLPDAAKDAKENESQPNGQLCKAMVPGLDVVCGEPEDNLIHDQSAGYAAYHPFSLTAQSAEKKSKKKAAAASATQSLEIEKDAAISAGAD